MRVICICLVVAAALSLAPSCAVAKEPAAIPVSAIVALQQELAAVSGQRESLVTQRRAIKSVARKGQTLITATPEASNRFVVLEVVFQSQKRLLSLENTERNREALFRTCESMVEAPDAHATVRLQADLLLAEQRLTANEATLAERAEELARIIGRYRDTEAEARSLMMALFIAKKLDAPDLERSIMQAMDERFSGDHGVIEFRREQLTVQRLDATLTGSFQRLDGTRLSFPLDLMGHMSLVVFWSKDDKDTEPLMKKIKEYEETYPRRFHVFSFNVDELPDGGASILREQGLDWTVMRLPGGRKHTAFRAYARGDAVALLVNAYGRVILKQAAHFDAIGWRDVQTDVFAISGARISNERYLAQLQSLLIGDFLVGDYFVAAPFRYRLTREEALANYREAEKRCADAIKKSPDAGLAQTRNRRIVALLGMWNLTCEPKHLEQATAEAHASLQRSDAGQAPVKETEPRIPRIRRDDVIPRFCLAKAELRQSGVDEEDIVTGFFEACGGSNAPASAVAAASILAVHAMSRELHETYRTMFLAAHGDDPEFYGFSSFLRDRQHRFRLLQPNHTKRERWERGYIVNFGGEPMTNRLPEIELKQLDGQPLILPKENSDKMTILVFLEPPEDGDKDFPVILDQHGRTNNTAGVRGMMSYAQLFADKHVNQGIDVVAAFLCDDAERVAWLMATNHWTCQAAMVPGGLKNPMVSRLGILSADRIPNVFLLRRDGTVAWWATGLEYRQFGNTWVHHLGMKVHIESCEVEYGYRLLEKGALKEAARIFAGPFLPWLPDRYGWRPPRYHGRAIALMALQDWDAALAAIDKAIDAHKLRHFRGRRSKGSENWREDAATVVMEQPCNTVSELWEVKATILDGLGRGAEAKALRLRFEGIDSTEHEDVYQQFHSRLRQFRLNEGPRHISN